MRSAPHRTVSDILYNFHWVVPGDAARAMQAWAGGLRPFLKRRGIAAIINLRGRNDDLAWWKQETAIAKSAGIAHLDAMLDSRKLPTRDMLVRLIETFDTAPRPFLLKCSGGQDRTSFAAALYLIHQGGWQAMAAAQAQFARFPYLHFPKTQQRWLKAFLDFAQADAGDQPLAAWIASSYTPEKLKAWLDAHGLAGGYAAIFTAPERSPRQW
jgi:protein tyrosine/serine phosphatase